MKEIGKLAASLVGGASASGSSAATGSSADEESLNQAMDPDRGEQFNLLGQEFQLIAQLQMEKLEVLSAQMTKLLKLALEKDQAVLKAKNAVVEVQESLTKIRVDLEKIIEEDQNIEAVIATSLPPPSLPLPSLTSTIDAPIASLTATAKLVKTHVEPLKEEYLCLDHSINTLIAELLRMEKNLVGGVEAIPISIRTITNDLGLLSEADNAIAQQAKPKAEEASCTVSGIQQAKPKAEEEASCTVSGSQK